MGTSLKGDGGESNRSELFATVAVYQLPRRPLRRAPRGVRSHAVPVALVGECSTTMQCGSLDVMACPPCAPRPRCCLCPARKSKASNRTQSTGRGTADGSDHSVADGEGS